MKKKNRKKERKRNCSHCQLLVYRSFSWYPVTSFHGQIVPLNSHIAPQYGQNFSRVFKPRAKTRALLMRIPRSLNRKPKKQTGEFYTTVEPGFNEVLGIMNDFLQPGQNYSRMHGKEPRFKEILVRTNTIHKRKRKIYLDIMI